MEATAKVKGNKMNKQTLLAVLQFLKEHNLEDTEALLKREAKLSEEDVQVKEEDTPRKASTVSQALAAYKNEGDPQLYGDYYAMLTNFVESSLDVHKCELSMVLYPVFVHMYLELVYNNHQSVAREFFEKFSLQQEEYYRDDLQHLSTVTKPEHMQGNQLLEDFKASKFTIRMSRDSYNHLKRHLLEKKIDRLLSIVQDHLFIDVFDGVPRSKQTIDATSGAMSGDARKEANKSKVYYGLLKEPDINIQLDDDEEAPEGGEDKPISQPKKKKAKKDPSLLKKSKNDPNAPALTRVPLPELNDQAKVEKAKAYKEALKRVSLNPENLPSVCFYTFLNAYQGLTSVDMSEDSSLLAAGFADSQIRVWSLTPSKLRPMKPGSELNLIDREADDVFERMMDDRAASECKHLLGHSGPVYKTSFSPDKTLMVSASEDATIRLWSLQTWTNLVVYKGHNYPVWDVAFSPHGHYFASAGNDRTARLWSTDHYQPLRIFAGHLADVDSCQFHPNSNYIATGSTDRTVRLWDCHNGHCVRVMTGHKGPIHAITFSKCGKYIASAGTDKTIILWDLASGEMLSQLRGHTDTIYTLAYSRDATLLASGGIDNTVRLWDMTKLAEDTSEAEGLITGLSDDVRYEVATIPTKSSPVLHVHFTRRNLLLASGAYTR